MSFVLRVACLCAAPGLPLFAQVINNASLTGKYGFREVVLAASNQVQTLFGTLTFDGKGGYTYAGQLLSGASAPAASSANNGTYSVQPSGLATISDPLQSGGQINARFASALLLGSNTETSNNSFSIFIAVPLPSAPPALTTFNGTYWVASLEFLNGNLAMARETLFQMTANSTGGFGSPTAKGQALNLGNNRMSQTISAATYNFGSDGSGSITLPPPSSDPAQVLIGGTKSIYAAPDGSFFVGGSTGAGGQGLLVGIKAGTSPSLTGLYWTADLYARQQTYSCSAGSADAVTRNTMTWSKRLRESGGAIDITTVTGFSINPDSSAAVFDNSSAVSANGQIFIGSGLASFSTDRYELFIGVSAPSVSGTGLYLNPQGVANVFSYAPTGNPIAPGEFITIFGSGLPVRSAIPVPFSTSLNGVQLMINNTPAPLYAITANQVFAVVPYSLTGSTASIVLSNNGTNSNTITVPIAATSPGIASQTQNGLGAGAITHADGSLVTPTSPALRGETVVIYLTGLGAVTPSVADGTAAPSKTLAKTSSVQTIYLNGVCPNAPNCDASNILFQGLTPGYAGLYQVNFTIPLTTAAGAAIPLALQTTTGFADMITIAIE